MQRRSKSFGMKHRIPQIAAGSVFESESEATHRPESAFASFFVHDISMRVKVPKAHPRNGDALISLTPV